MAFKEIGKAKPSAKVERPDGALRRWLAVAGSAAAGIALIAAATLPYDRIQPRAGRDYDIVEQMPTDANVSTPEDVIAAYHLGGNVRSYLRVEGDQIYFEPQDKR